MWLTGLKIPANLRYLQGKGHSLYNQNMTVSAMFSKLLVRLQLNSPEWGAVDAQVTSVENTELEGSPFKAFGRSVYSHTCYAYYQGYLPC